MKLKFAQITLLVLTLVAGTIAEAKRAKAPQQLGQARVDYRQNRQAERIENGLENGRLTQAEYERLKKRQEKIAAREQAFLADGVLSADEAQKLEKMQKRASKKIYSQKHDKQRNRTKRQADRIEKSINQGELTTAEQKRLEETQKAIAAYRQQALQDGQLSTAEKKVLRSMQEDSSDLIYKLKHNDREPASDFVASVPTAAPVQAATVQSGVQ